MIATQRANGVLADLRFGRHLGPPRLSGRRRTHPPPRGLGFAGIAHLTESQRVQRIKELVADLHKVPPEKHETVRVPWTQDERQLLDVITIGVDEVLLNPQSHRIRAQLQDDPAWADLSKDPFSEVAQRTIERHVRDARDPDEFQALKDSLLQDGQTDPGVMTHSGLLINANTRAAALRDVEDPTRRTLRVAVLPPTAKAEELTLLELRLQMQKDLKVDYTLTNELLFIEELSSARRLSARQIARELRIHPDNEKKGAAEIEARLQYLDLIRVMQRTPARPLPLTFFNAIKLEQLREIHRVRTGLLQTDPARAQTHLENFLLSVAVGIKAVHEIRQVDADFMADYMLPQLEEDEGIGQFATQLATAPPEDAPRPAGVGALITDDGDQAPEINTRHLINVVTSRDKTIDVPGTKFVLDRDDVKDALKTAVAAGIKDKKREKKDEDQLAAPVNAVKEATKQLQRAKEAFLSVEHDPDYDDRRRKTLEAAVKKLARASRDLKATLAEAGVIES
jgi:hypothetical protein